MYAMPKVGAKKERGVTMYWVLNQGFPRFLHLQNADNHVIYEVIDK